MEPMTLGSPTGSPPSPTGPDSASQYLPQFLTGDSILSAAIASGSLARSPAAKQTKHVTFAELPLPKSPTPRREAALLLQGETPSHRLSQSGRSPIERGSGPPIIGLFDTQSICTTLSPIPPTTNFSTLEDSPAPSSFGGLMSASLGPVASPYASTPLQGRSTNTSMIGQGANFFSSPAVDSSHYRMSAPTRCDGFDETWVTVFGIPPGAASFVLNEFSEYGTILEKKIPAKGNWIHLHYQTPLQAQKALSRNGKMLGRSMMIGVMLCQDQNVQNESVKENLPVDQSSLNQSRLTSRSFNTTDSPRGVRQLTQAYRIAQAESEVISNTSSPQRSTSILSKAMETVFGW